MTYLSPTQVRIALYVVCERFLTAYHRKRGIRLTADEVATIMLDGTIERAMYAHMGDDENDDTAARRAAEEEG